MTERYYVPNALESKRIRLEGSEAHHLLRVMRLESGATVTLFDGSGVEFEARIIQAGRRDVQLEVISQRIVDREARRDVTLGVAFPTGHRQSWLVEKATEIGIRRIVPLITEKNRVPLEPKSVDRLRRTVIETSKQCGRNCLMEISLPVRLDEFLSSETETWRILAHPFRENLEDSDHPRNAYQDSRPVRVAVGPAGGFHDDEVRLAVQLGWETWHLGARILRTETAALAIGCQLILAPLPGPNQ